MAKFANYLTLFLLVASLVMMEVHSSSSTEVPDQGRRLLMNPDSNGIPCGESCVFIPCISALLGCSCSNKVCYNNRTKS
uniref:Cyclotide chassatide C18 n=1 Tax=Chassalia chartacea TaxID=510798 RepID=I0B6G1_CHACT|nr:cyclotide precursor chassatide C18 [Chassalia chartacea]AFH57365.1 cyclotide precursor chassatide C18 [Chassalia chartacea]